MKKLILKSLTLAVNTALLAAVATTAHAAADKKPIGDLEIYKAAEAGSATITMMLDISGSMWTCDRARNNTPSGVTLQYNFTDAAGNTITEIKDLDKDPTGQTTMTIPGTIQMYAEHCGGAVRDADEATPYLNRMGTLKHAMMSLIADGTILTSNNKIGLGVFPYPGAAGSRIIAPAHKLTPEHRWRLLKLIAGLSEGGGTPSAMAYADAAAYMMGTTTADAGTTLQTRYFPKVVATYRGGAWQLTRVDYLRESNNTTAPIRPDWWQKNSEAPIRVPTPYPDGWFTNRAYNYTFIRDPSIHNLKPGYFATVTHAATRGSSLATCRAYPSQLIELTSDGKIPASVTFNPTCQTYVEFGEKVTGYLNSANPYSGLQWSVADTKKADQKTYQSPIEEGQCDGYGVYFLTDGEPNNNVYANNMMNKALNGRSLTSTTPALPNNGAFEISGGGSGWSLIGEFSKRLRDTSNPSGQVIKTATVGFGSVFTSGANLKYTNKDVDGKSTRVIDCDASFTGADARNLCKWGSKGYGFGEGGFLATNEAQAVGDSVVEFVRSLKNEIPSAPSGVITVPDDPYSVSAQQAFAYMPVMEAKVGSTDFHAVWPGNMKKYQLRGGTIWGQNGRTLYGSTVGSFNENVKDEWSTENEGNGALTTGGFYAQLSTPASGIANIRTVYIEDYTSASNTKPMMRKFGVNADGKITLDGNESVAFNDTTTYTPDRVKYLLHFLGFESYRLGTATTNISIDNIDANTNLANITLVAPSDSIRVLGASPHSAPTAVSYQAGLDATGSVSTDESARQDYVIFGSMDGALHMADARNGRESFAFIPKTMLLEQAVALKVDGTVPTAAQPKFGIDAPWLVSATYDYHAPTATAAPTHMKAKEDIYAYGGMRMGGDGIFGLNLGRTQDSAPQLAFALTPSTSGFSRLGQVWTRPTKTKILLNNNPTDVLIFGGGYDMCYENENFQVGLSGEEYAIANDQNGTACSTKTQDSSVAIGNAVYMVNARTGELIWSVSNSANTTSAPSSTHEDIKHSIVASVNTIDRNGDGYADAIYFADLGGQIFRADAPSNTHGVPSRVVKLLSAADAGSKYVRRFYEKPVLSVYRTDGFNGNKRFVLVNAITGDRSNPTSTMRTTSEQADRIYGVLDVDIGKPNSEFYGSSVANLSVKNVEDNQMVNLTGITTQALKESRLASVKDPNNHGWYYPLTYFDGWANVKYTKGVGKSEVIGSLLYSAVYNPDMDYNGNVGACAASVTGGSEYQMYCLPFGICMNETSLNGRGGYLPAGQGISELTLGPLDSSQTGRTKRVLISNVTVDGRVGGDGTQNRKDYNSGDENSPIKKAQGAGAEQVEGDGTMPNIVFDQRFALQPLRWYDNSIKNN